MFAALEAPILDSTTPYLLQHDFEAYIRCQVEVSRTFRDKRDGCRKSFSQCRPEGEVFHRPDNMGYAKDI